jgi:iron(III) transport system permease protein
MSWGRWQYSLPILILYGGLVLLPALLPFSALATPPADPRRAPSLWDPALHGPLMANSLKLAVTVTLAALSLTVPLALVLYRTRLPLRTLWLGTLLVPLLVPPYILGVGVLHILGPRAAVGFTGSASTLTLWLLPFGLLFAGAGLRFVTRAQEESALLDTSWPGVLRHVTLPLALPHLLAGALYVFVLALGEFGVPVLFQYRVYPGAIFAQFAAFYDLRQAILTALPLLVVVLATITAAQVVWQGGEREGAAEAPVQLNPGRGCSILALGVALAAVAVLSPLMRIISEVGSGTVLFQALLLLGPQALETFLWAAVGGGGAVGLALLAAWLAARLQPAWGSAFVGAQLPLFALPAVLLGLGLIQFWNVADWRSVVYTAPVILALGYTARFTPLLVPLLAASYRQLPVELDEAARLDGAGPLRLLLQIHVPLLRPVLGMAGLLTFVLCVGEVPVSLLVAPPGHAPLAVRFITLITNAPSEQVAALSLITTVLALLPVAAWLVWGDRVGRSSPAAE